MATALQQQLAAIAANSTHELDLKAQKARHGRSLLFEPREAVTQSFDTIFEICVRGFEELCILDSRFLPFSKSLFAEQSKSEDRTQLTSAENKELDTVVEAFLGLLCGRLLLKPAILAAEWLVRRFRVQEYNTSTVLLAFMPYHTAPVFPVLLSILPNQIPNNLRFLQPYITSRQCPPRHAILSATISDPGFFNDFSQFVLKTTRAQHSSAVLLGFWASMTAQAVSGLLDATQSGRQEVRVQREEDVLLRILPVLQSAFSITNVSEMYLSCCMIITILATKITLEERVLDVLMEAVAEAWNEHTIDDGMMCLAVLAEEKRTLAISTKVHKRLAQSQNLLQLFTSTSRRLRTEKLLVGISLALICREDVDPSRDGINFVETALRKELYGQHGLQMLIDALMGLVGDDDDAAHKVAVQASATILKSIVASDVYLDSVGALGQERAAQVSERLLALNLSDSRQSYNNVDVSGDVEMGNDDTTAELATDSSKPLSALIGLGGTHPSFLDTSNEVLFTDYANAFQIVVENRYNEMKFFDLPSLTAKDWIESIPVLTFLARSWTEDISIHLRVRALERAAMVLVHLSKTAGTHIDLHHLYPYLLVALSDPAASVRRAASKLCSLIGDAHFEKEAGTKNSSVWAEKGIYRASPPSKFSETNVSMSRLFKDIILPHLQDCVLDADRLNSALSTAFKGPAFSSANGRRDSLDSVTCANLAETFAEHAVHSPVLRVKVCMLDAIARSGKHAEATKKKILLPFIRAWVNQTRTTIEEMCRKQHMEPNVLESAVLGCLSYRSEEDMTLLKEIADGTVGDRQALIKCVFGRLRLLWRSMKLPMQISFIDLLVSLAVQDSAEGADTTRQVEALGVIRSVKYSSEVLNHLLKTIPTATKMQESQPSTKRRRTSKSGTIEQKPTNVLELRRSIRRITVILEAVEGAKPRDHPQLLKSLFNLLGEIHTYKALLGSQLLYLQEILLNCLLSVVEANKHLGLDNVDRSSIRADLVVEAVRTTTSTQVHNAALLLMSSLASWMPDLVLHNIMPLFTFMSTTLLRQNDEYSAHVTDQAVARIVPALVTSLRKRGKDLATGASELLLSFTTAYEHIPLHRRTGLFVHLVRTLGADDSLYAVIAMLIEKFPDDAQMHPFIIELSNHFSVTTNLKTFQQFLDLVSDGLRPKRGLSDTILGFSEKDSEQISSSLDNLLRSLAELMQNNTLRKRLAKELDAEITAVKDIQTTYAGLLDHVMRLLRITSVNEDLKVATDAVLASLLALTPTKDFIESSARLMQTGSDETRQQVFRSLEARVAEARRNDFVLQQVYLEVLPNCCAFLRSDQPVLTRHSAITCIDQIIEKYGKKDQKAVIAAAQEVMGPDALGSKESSLRVISILCLASMVEVLGDEFISIIPRALDTALGYLEETLAAQFIDQNIHSAVFALTSALLDHLPWMFSSKHLDRALRLSAHSAARGILADSTQFCALAARKVSADESFAAIQRTWNDVTRKGSAAVIQQLQFLRGAIETHDKPTIARNSITLFTVLLQAFDLRVTLPQETSEADTFIAAFAMVDQIALDMTLKLNDTTFRPFFLQLTEWTQTSAISTKPVKYLRKTALYSFIHVLFEQLKAIVTSYISFVLDDAAQLLETLNVQKPIERNLFEIVLNVLSSSFRHDQDDFWQAPAHMDAIKSPVIRQLEKAAVVPAQENIIPAIVDLAEAAGSPEHHKAMNALILGYMRHEQAAVRLAAIRCERAITERLNFDWLALLPEMLPFISESQEDDDEEVERETLRWVKQIEDVTGESLDSMLR